MRDRTSIFLTGRGGDVVAAAIGLCGVSARPTIITPANCRDEEMREALRNSRKLNCDIEVVWGSEVACVDGITHLESLVVRHISSGRLTARNAELLVVVGEQSQPLTFPNMPGLLVQR